MILPFVTIGSKIFFCSLADRHRAYRSFFIAFLVAALIGYGSFGVLPFFIVPQPKERGLNHATWALICLMTSVATISMSVLGCLSDAFAMNSSKKRNTSYGFIRVWGTLGWGASSIVISFINQIESLPFLVPGILLLIGLIVLDIVVVTLWPYRNDFELDKSCSDIELDNVITVSSIEARTTRDAGHETKSVKAQGSNNYGSVVQGQPNRLLTDLSSISVQWILFKEVAKRRRSIFRFMILFTISGALISLQWSYFFPYLMEIHPKEFSSISGLSMVSQSMLGELPFFLLSKYVINILGRSHTLSISIVSIGFRYLLYEYLLPNSSMYFVLLSETFQGPNFGLFYVVMTDVGLDYSDCEEAIVSIVNKGIIPNNPEQIQKLRQALRATMQSLMSACYEGLGIGIGSIIGGLVIDYYGFSKLWFWAAVTAIVLGLTNWTIEVLGLPIFVDRRSQLVLRA